MTSSEIESNLQDLKNRRADVEAERAEAEKAVREARAALVRGDAEDTDDVNELAALTGTVEAMDEEIAAKHTALKETRADFWGRSSRSWRTLKSVSTSWARRKRSAGTPDSAAPAPHSLYHRRGSLHRCSPLGCLGLLLRAESPARPSRALLSLIQPIP